MPCQQPHHVVSTRVLPFWIGLLVGMAVVLLAQLVTGETADPAREAPEFPFQNIAQLEGIPGLTADLPHKVLPRMGHETAIARFRDPTGEITWQIFVQLDGNHVTGASYGLSAKPVWIYVGTHSPENGRITIQRVAPFDPAIHFTPCSTWGVPA